MKPHKLIQGLGLSLACAGLALPTSILAAQPAASSPQIVAAPTALDVSLHDGGVLEGQVVSPQGIAMADAPVTVWHQSKVVATTRTDATGHFAVSGLREGTHAIEAGKQVAQCRFWNAVTAPPSAQAKVLLVNDTRVARGQEGGNYNGLMWTALGAGVAGGLIAEGNNHHHHHHHHHEHPSSD